MVSLSQPSVRESFCFSVGLLYEGHCTALKRCPPPSSRAARLASLAVSTRVQSFGQPLVMRATTSNAQSSFVGSEGQGSAAVTQVCHGRPCPIPRSPRFQSLSV